MQSAAELEVGSSMDELAVGPAADEREQLALWTVRLHSAFDMIIRAGVLLMLAMQIEPAGTALAANIALPLVATFFVWRLLRGPLFVGFAALAGLAAFASLQGPVAAVLAGAVFWSTFFAALSDS